MPEISLKEGWTRVAFGEVVRQVRDRVDPSRSGLERFVAGEHMDSGELRIRRWGTIGSGYLGPAFHMRFKPGHVLYGSRRTYLRKVAVADFEGITANTTFVIETKDPMVLLPDLLPFIMQAESFHEHSERQSKGSVNPYVNFSDLTWYEFYLPPLAKQHAIARLLAASQRIIESVRHALTAVARARAAFVTHLILGARISRFRGELTREIIPAGWRLVPASELSTELVTKGATPSHELTKVATGIPFLKVYNLTFDGSLDFTIEPTYISAQGHRALRRSTVLPGDVLMNIVGPPLGKVSLVPKTFSECNINQAIVRYRPEQERIGVWLTAYLLSPLAHNWLLARSKKTSGQRNLTLETCRDLPVPVPPEGDIERIINQLACFESTARRIRDRLDHAKTLGQRLVATALEIGRV